MTVKVSIYIFLTFQVIIEIFIIEFRRRTSENPSMVISYQR